MTLFKRAFANRIRGEAVIQSDEAEMRILADTFGQELAENENPPVEPMRRLEARDSQPKDIADPVGISVTEGVSDADLVSFDSQTEDEANFLPMVPEDIEDTPDLKTTLSDVIAAEQPVVQTEDKAEPVLAPERKIEADMSNDDDQTAMGEVAELDALATDMSIPDIPEYGSDPIALSGPEPSVEAMLTAETPPTSNLQSASEEVEQPAVLLKPIEGRSGRRAGRVKTRMLGFSQDDETQDPFSTSSSKRNATTLRKFPVGWCVVTKGPGQGHAFPLHYGVSSIGRSEDQAIPLNFGDTSISRENHAAIAYDNEQNGFFLGQSGKSNIIRLNERPVLSTETLSNGDQIRIGETTLRFVALCDEAFQWDDGDVGV
jgi:hypothetical protein